ncbi:enteropeptidase-like [Pocillopora damicornis]|uniref:enteropeptidase-like n=1 Tax=Pocillopora damicornis TaxID=46731 RepID=UPI000F550DD2|nr:enteropeptidase-like [Pocillopora damicornis]
MTVGFRKTNNSNSAVLGKLSGLNIWSYPVSITEILSMSYGCGTEAGDSKSWETVRDKIIGEVEVKDSRTCKDRKASRLVAEGIRVHVNQSALFMSPLYDASRGGQSRCLRFRYMLQGPGEKALTVYRKAKKYREIPIWISKGITRGNWVYGQVQLSSISDFQVLIKAEMGSGEDLIALTGLYIDEGKNCRVTPLSAKKACSENLINETGYFFSPSYPGNPPDDTFCKWHITVQKNHIIRLEFQEFLLTNHPTCERCFLQIFDGRDLSATAIGKFCGYMHPPVVISSSSHFTIVFRCLEGLRMTRFKAFYHSIRTQYWEGSSCSLHRECPSSCECKEFGEVYDKRILIIGEKLLAIPSNLPPNTGAVVFRQNRISQLHEKEFSDLTILEYIDLSFNNLLHLDEECFHNVSSVTTL